MRYINRDEFKKHILRSLGGGINNIHVTPDQLDDRIDDAVTYFQRHHPDGSGKVVLVLPKEDKYQTEYYLPEEVLSVSDILQGRYNYFNSQAISANPNESVLWGDQYAFGSYGGGRDGQVITPYYIQQQNYNTLRDVMYAMPEYDFNHVTGLLKLHSPIDRRNYYNYTQALYIECMVQYSEDVYPRMYDHEWLREYAEALVGEQWGRNITLFMNVPLAGESQLNGKGILDMYSTKRVQLESMLNQRIGAIYRG